MVSMVINIMRISIYIIILVIFFVVKVIVVGVFEKKKCFIENEIKL